MSPFQIECIFDQPSSLGESPLWHIEEQALYWVDIEKPALHRFDPKTKQHRMWPMPTSIACIGLHEKNGLIAAMRYGFAHILLPSGKVEMISSPISDSDGVMFNDGNCDRAGRFWAGTKDTSEGSSNKSIYRLDHDQLFKITDGFAITNGIVWSPDNSIAYICDSLARIIYQYDFSIATGILSNQEIFAQIPEEKGYPDGLAVDSEGGIWNAHWGGGCITRYLPNGNIDHVIHLPVPHPTSCCFGGPNLKTLYITSARLNMSDEEIKQNPLSGCIFATRLDITGVPETSYLA